MTRLFLALLLCLVPVAAVQAQGTTAILTEPLTNADNTWLDAQRERINALSQRNYGTLLRGDAAHDLRILQRLLDENVVRADKVASLQAMGVILGDLLARELGMRWVVIIDDMGRARGLQLGTGNNFLFPITMISRRAEIGMRVDVAALYQKGLDEMRAMKK